MDHSVVLTVHLDLRRAAAMPNPPVMMTYNHNIHAIHESLEYGPMPNVMVALPNIGGAICSTPQSLADAHYYMPCSNAAKTRKPFNVAGVLQTSETISAASGP